MPIFHERNSCRLSRTSGSSRDDTLSSARFERIETLSQRHITTWAALKRSFKTVFTIIRSVVGDRLDGLPAELFITSFFAHFITSNTPVLERETWAAISLWLSFTSRSASTIDFSSFDNAHPCPIFVSPYRAISSLNSELPSPDCCCNPSAWCNIWMVDRIQRNRRM